MNNNDFILIILNQLVDLGTKEHPFSITEENGTLYVRAGGGSYAMYHNGFNIAQLVQAHSLLTAIKYKQNGTI